MKIKYNDATHNRPGGRRILDAPFVFIDLQLYINQLKQEEAWQKSGHNGVTVFKNDQMAEVLICIRENAVIENNSVNGIVSIQVLEGKINMLVETEEIEMATGQLITMHQYINHSIEARKDSVLLITTTVDLENEIVL